MVVTLHCSSNRCTQDVKDTPLRRTYTGQHTRNARAGAFDILVMSLTYVQRGAHAGLHQ